MAIPKENEELSLPAKILLFFIGLPVFLLVVTLFLGFGIVFFDRIVLPFIGWLLEVVPGENFR